MAATARSVKVIPQTINPATRMPDAAVAKRRVAGYARVSTDSDEQFTSYEAQVDYYTQFIKSKPDWAFVDVYTDEGISGTNTKHRAGFNKMIQDALDGKNRSHRYKVDFQICEKHGRYPHQCPYPQGTQC